MLAALAASGLLLTLASDPASEPSYAPGIVPRPQPAEASRPRWEPPLLPPARPTDVDVLPMSAPEDVAAASLLVARIDAAIADMSASLRDGPVDRSSWETRVRAVGGSLGSESIPLLLERAADAALPDEHLVAVAELLRAGSSIPGGLPAPLPEPALGALRRSLDAQPRRPSATPAARSLGALGARGDTLRLLDELADPASRSLASWGLQASPSVAILDDLRPLLGADIHAESRQAVLTTMEGWARAGAPERLEAPSRDATASALAALVDDALVESGLRQRAAGALDALGGASARSVAEEICGDPASEDGLLSIGICALARDGDPASIRLLEDELWDASTPESRRLALAEGLVRIGDSRPARRALLEVTFASRSASDQRRALYALAALPGGSDTVAAAATALGSPDPAVRAAGVWALDRTAGSLACADRLRWLGETDASETVRRSARRAVERLAPSPAAASP